MYKRQPDTSPQKRTPASIIKQIADINDALDQEAPFFEEEDIDIAKNLLKRCEKTLEKESSVRTEESKETA